MMPQATRFEKLLEAVPDALVGVDEKGVIRFVNRQTELLFGYDRDQLIGEHIDTLAPEPLWGVCAEHRQNYFADPGTRSLGLDLELSGHHEDGSEFPIDVTMSRIDTRGVLLVITGSRDVARQKQAVAKAERLDAIVEYADDAILGLTLGGIVTSWNPAAERMYGYSNVEMIGRSGGLLTPQDRAGELELILDRIKDGRYVEHAETTLVRKDGTTVPVSIAAAPIRSEDGTVVGVSAVHRDVTKQRQAFEATQRLAEIVENSQDAIVGQNLNGAITSWNPAAERMFGYSPDDVIGASADFLTPEDQANEVGDFTARIKAGQPVEEFETLRVRKDGTRIPVSITVSPIVGEGGELVGTSTIVRDLTEVKHAALYARSLLEAALDPLVTISRDGKISDVNEATVKATGFPRSKLIGTRFSEYFTDPGKAQEGYEQVFAQGSVTDYPLTLRHRDGTQMDVLYNASVYRDSNADVLGVFAAARNVTDQKKAFESAERMSAIVENSEDAIFSGSLEGDITSWNPAAERLYGYTCEEIVGKPAALLLPKDRAGELQAILEKVKAGQHVREFETTRVRMDGTLFPISLTVSPLRDVDGAVVGTSVIHRDRTEQVRAERALAETNRHYRLLAENASDLVAMTSPDRVITWVSPSLTRSLEWAVQDLMGKRLLDLVHPDDAAATAGAREDMYRGHEVTTPAGGFLMRMRTKSGQYRWMSGVATPVTDEVGVFTGVVSGLRDVDDLVQARQEAEALGRALKSSNDSLRDFVAVASHDLRSPLVTIAGFTKILTDHWATLSDKDRLKQLGAIQRGVDRLSRLTNDLLTSAKVEAEAEQTRPEHIRLAIALAGYLQADREELATVAMTCPPELVAVVDPSHLTRILDNYLGNAFKYGEPPICIEAERVGDFVELRVLDHGPGVPPEFVSRLFTKFDRGNAPTSGATQGTGLGLSIVKALAEANHGDARYQHNEPKGGCFVVRLPAALPS